MRLLVILNPAARDGRAGRARDLIRAALVEAGAEVEIALTGRLGDGERRAREASDVDAVVVAGGDGTVHEVVNGLVGTGTPLGVLPFGTGNDFAHALGMPDLLGDAVRALVAAPVVPVDVGRVAWTEATDGTERARYFANCLGAGFDAHAARIAGETKWLGGRAAYLAAVLRTLWVWRRPDLRVRVAVRHAEAAAVGAGPVEEAEPLFRGALFLCEIGNGHSVGGGFLLTPDAVPNDGRLDVCLVRHMSPSRALRLLPQSFTGAHVGAPEVVMDRVLGLEMDVEAGAVALQADGEGLTLGARRLAVEVVPGALSVLAPGLG